MTAPDPDTHIIKWLISGAVFGATLASLAWWAAWRDAKDKLAIAKKRVKKLVAEVLPYGEG